jgi:hypothetical protein
MSLLRAYFDESEAQLGPPFMGVAGYVFDPASEVEFDREWREMLDDVSLPFFHMTSCEAREEPFSHLEYEVRLAIQGRAGRIVNKWMTQAVVVSVDPIAYNELTPQHRLVPRNAYAFCVNGCFHAVRQRSNETNFVGEIEYFFEAGQKHQEDTDSLMREYMSAPDSSEMFRYKSHTFINKTDSTILQAADLLVWHCMKNHQLTERGDYSRDDFAALVDDRYWRWHFDRPMIEDHAEMIARLAEQYPDAGKALPKS